MFANDRQTSRAILVLFRLVPALDGLWTVDGPTPEALEMYEAGGGPLSSGEASLLLAAFALWNTANETLSFARLYRTLSGQPFEALLTLLLAVDKGDGAVETWLTKWDRPADRLRPLR